MKDEDILKIIAEFRDKYSLEITKMDLEENLTSSFEFYCEKGKILDIFCDFCVVLSGSICNPKYEIINDE